MRSTHKKKAKKKKTRRVQRAPRVDEAVTSTLGSPTLGSPTAGAARFGYGYPIEARVEFFQAYEDASGVGCRISWGDFMFSFDVRGEIKQSLIRVPPGATPLARQIAHELCTLAFLGLFAASVDMAWREKNIRLHGVLR